MPFPHQFGQVLSDPVDMSQALQANFRQAYTKSESNGLYIPQSLLTTRGDLIRRGASAPERVALGASGSGLASDGTDAVWNKQFGFIGRSTNTAGASASILAGGSNAMGPLVALVVTGDDVNYMELDLFSYGPYISSGATGHFNVGIWDSGLGSFVSKQQCYVPATGISAGGISCKALQAPFSGSKTFWLVVENATVGTATFNIQAGAALPTYLTARWAGSTGHA